MAKFFSVLGPVLFVYAICGHASIASERLYVAGGCIWCVEADFESISGVIEVRTGFSGGSTKNPNYKDVSKGGSCLLYTSPSPRDATLSRMPSSA